MAAVAALTLLCTGTGTLGSVNYAHLTPLQVVYIFFSGMVAITAMVMPGISGSSILLTAGVYLPTIQAIHSFLRLQLDVVPGCAPWALASSRGWGCPSTPSAPPCAAAAARWSG